MSTFKFRLQKVLDIKQKEEESIKIRLQKELSNKKNIEEMLFRYNLEKEKGMYEFAESILEKKIKLNYISRLDGKIQGCKVNLLKVEENIRGVRSELLECTKELKAMEKLKDKKYREYMDEINRIEQIQNDEFALSSFIKRIKIEEVN